MEVLTREQYKGRFLARFKITGRKTSVPISMETKNRLRQLCTAADGPRTPLSCLVERIVNEHCETHEETIRELYQRDIPVY